MQKRVDAELSQNRPQSVHHQRHERRIGAGAPDAGEWRRSDRVRPVVRDVQASGDNGGGTVVEISTYPDFRIDVDRVRAAITPRTKVILFNSPSNPTGAVATAAETEALAKLALEKGIALLSDEIYRGYCHDGPFVSPAKWNPQTIVIDGFSKSHSMTGLRLGWLHAPSISCSR